MVEWNFSEYIYNAVLQNKFTCMFLQHSATVLEIDGERKRERKCFLYDCHLNTYNVANVIYTYAILFKGKLSSAHTHTYTLMDFSKLNLYDLKQKRFSSLLCIYWKKIFI